LNTEAVGQIEDFDLIDADTEIPIQLLRNGSVINTVMLATSNFNIEARVTNGIVRSIRFGYNNIFNYRIENEEPFAFCGNTRANYATCSSLSKGQHTIKATPFFNQSARGPAGMPLAVTFTIIDSPIPTTKMPIWTPATFAPTKSPTILAPISSPTCLPLKFRR
jgi:hypothetical protein